MKVKKVRTIKDNKSNFGLKDLRVNLVRLDRETIRRYVKSAAVDNFNLCIKIKNGKVEFGRESGTTVPMTITISSLCRSKPNEYSLRTRSAPLKKEIEVPRPKNSLSEMTLSVRKNQLWASCKRAVDKSKLIEGSIVFGKQVNEQFFDDVQSIFRDRWLKMLIHFRMDIPHGQGKYWRSLKPNHRPKYNTSDTTILLDQFLRLNLCS